jgi:polygalacturonase
MNTQALPGHPVVGRRFLDWFVLLGFCGSVGAVPALPTIPPGIFNVANYGAVGDSVTTNTAAIQAAIDALNAAGGGTLEVPPGAFLSGPLRLDSHTRFQLDAGATLLLLPYGSYPGKKRPPSFITVRNRAHDIEFCGPGTIDGQGAPWWAAHLDERHRPYEIHLENCRRVFIHDWNSRNPPMKHIVIDGAAEDITVQNVTNTAPYPSPNTDGINLQGMHCLVQNSTFRGGDDNIAIGRGSGSGTDILITNCAFGTGHGMSLGSITTAGISNVTVVDCTFSGTDFGIRLKSGPDRGGLVRNITYRNISMTNVATAIAIYSYYKEKGPNHISPAQAARFKALPVARKTPIWRDIVISNVTATGSVLAGIIWGRPEMLVSNVTLEQVSITAEKTFNIYNARGIHLVDSSITVSNGSSLSFYNAQVDIRNRGPRTNQVLLDGLSGGNSLALDNARASLASANALGANPITLRASVLTDRQNLTLPGSTVLNFALGTNCSTLKVEGNLTFSGILNITAGDGFQAGTYTLFDCSGSCNAHPQFGAIPAGYECRFDTSIPSQGRLLVSRRQ